MPSTVSELLHSASLKLGGVVWWSTPVPTRMPGVYVVSLSPDPGQNNGVVATAPINWDIVAEWIARVPTLELDGERGPDPGRLARRIGAFWLADENVLYIRKATSLRSRVGDYYRTPLGDRRPHAGGHWIKTLSLLNETRVYFAEASDPPDAEARLMKAFIAGVSQIATRQVRDPSRPFPFANLEFPRGNIKNHGLSKSKI